MNILAVDNNIDILEALSDYCTLQGIDCEVTSDGIRGLFKIQKKDYDLILLDMAMPDYSGYDILNQLKKQNLHGKNIVVITATGLKKNDFDEYTGVG